MLRISRSTATRAITDGRLKGTKMHECGTQCSNPDTCRQGGHWEFSDTQIEEFLANAKHVRKED
ncbi:hypothetical protein HS041_22585 [Planomonospora sp. ID67723]|nr:hypothetical protein [Planomonospora sp. ID67723]